MARAARWSARQRTSASERDDGPLITARLRCPNPDRCARAVACCRVVVHDDVDDPARVGAAGDSRDRDLERARIGRVHGDERIHTAADEKPLSLVDRIRPPPVAGQEVEIPGAEEVTVYPADDRGRLVDLGHHDANRQTPPPPERAREGVGPVSEADHSVQDAVLGALRDCVGGRRAIEDDRDRGRREGEIVSQPPEGDGPLGCPTTLRGLALGRHGAVSHRPAAAASLERSALTRDSGGCYKPAPS